MTRKDRIIEMVTKVTTIVAAILFLPFVYLPIFLLQNDFYFAYLMTVLAFTFMLVFPNVARKYLRRIMVKLGFGEVIAGRAFGPLMFSLFAWTLVLGSKGDQSDWHLEIAATAIVVFFGLALPNDEA